jgi:hypothetical protein
MSTSTASSRSISLPSAPVLVGGVYAICVLGLIAIFVGDIVLSDKDSHRAEGPIASIVAVGAFGTAALAIGVGLALWLARSPERARAGALVLGALSVLTLPVFWSGAPGVFGACAVWVAGLTRGGRPLGGAGRAAGIVGGFIALLNIVVTVGSLLVHAV